MTLSTAYHIRAARLDDVPAIASLVEEFARYMRELGDTSPLQLTAEALERDGFGPHPAFRGLVVEVAGKVVGFLLHHPGYDTDAACRLLFVVDVYVKGSMRGQDLGIALMNAARNVALEGDAKQIVWTVDRRNVRAQRFYEGIGAAYVESLQLMYMDV